MKKEASAENEAATAAHTAAGFANKLCIKRRNIFSLEHYQRLQTGLVRNPMITLWKLPLSYQEQTGAPGCPMGYEGLAVANAIAPKRIAGLGGLIECQSCRSVGADARSIRDLCLWAGLIG